MRIDAADVYFQLEHDHLYIVRMHATHASDAVDIVPLLVALPHGVLGADFNTALFYYARDLTRFPDGRVKVPNVFFLQS